MRAARAHALDCCSALSLAQSQSHVSFPAESVPAQVQMRPSPGADVADSRRRALRRYGLPRGTRMGGLTKRESAGKRGRPESDGSWGTRALTAPDREGGPSRTGGETTHRGSRATRSAAGVGTPALRASVCARCMLMLHVARCMLYLHVACCRLHVACCNLARSMPKDETPAALVRVGVESTQNQRHANGRAYSQWHTHDAPFQMV